MMSLQKSSSKNELLHTSYNLPQLSHSGSRGSLQSPQSKNNHSFNLYYASSSNLSPQNNSQMVRVSSELFPTEHKAPAFEKVRRSVLSTNSYEVQTNTLAKSSSFGSLMGTQSTSSRSKLLPSIQFTHSNDTQNSLLDVSLSPKKPTFNVSFQQIQSPKASDKKALSIGNEFQATLGEINVLKYIEKQNDTIAKLTKRIQSQERKERQRKTRPKLSFEDKEESFGVNTSSIKLDPITNEQPETAYTLKDVAIAPEELQKQEGEDSNNNDEQTSDFTNVKKRKSILKVSTRGQGSTLSDLIKLQCIRDERRDSSRSSRVTFAEDGVNSAKSEKEEEEPESPIPKGLFVKKSVSDHSNLSSAEIAKLAAQNIRDKRLLVPRRSLFEPQSASSLESTRKNSDSCSETNSEDSSSSPKRERRSFRRVGRVTLPGRSKLGKILTTKVYQDEQGMIIKEGKPSRQKLNSVLWAMVFPNLLSKQCQK